MKIYLLFFFVAGIAYADEPEIQWDVDKTMECFKSNNYKFTEEVDDQEKCWRELNTREDNWDKEFCAARLRKETGENPCGNIPFFVHFEECAKPPEVYAYIVKGFLKEIEEKFCKNEVESGEEP